ncbi:MAG: hypothetical protein AB7P76_02700 [Candidatus Melainabacteria bacterium]
MLTTDTKPLERLLFAAGNKIEGKKKLHKLAYLCQEAGTDLNLYFTFHYYGVYSPTLTELVDQAKGLGIVDISDSLTLSPVTIQLKSNNSVSIENEPGLRLVSQLQDESPRTLEVLSTIVFLDRRGHTDIDSLKAKLIELKGHLTSYYDKAFLLAKQHFNIA